MSGLMSRTVIGYTRNGKPVFAIGGGAGDETPETPPADTEPSDTSETEDVPDDDKPLGPEGEKALRAFKERAREAEKQAKRVPELEAELAKIREDAMSDQEKQLEQVRKEAFDQGRNDALQDANVRLFRAEVKAASAGKLVDSDLLSDPIVAQKLLKFDDLPFTSDGDIDAGAISAAVDAMLEAKPHLAASATRTPGSADQGARPAGTPPRPKSLEDAFAVHYNK